MVPTWRGRPRDDGLGVGHLRDPVRADERRHLDRGQARGREPIDELDPVLDCHHRALVLEAVARSDLDDAHGGAGRG